MADFEPDVIAHRGASCEAPENTLAAFELAWRHGADGIEGDFRLTGDGHVVCIHDATTRRVSDISLTVAESAFEDLRALDVGSWKGPEWAGQRIPTLQEVLAAIPKDKKIFAELKCGAEVLPPVKAAVDGSALKPEQLALISFSKTVVAEAKRFFPDSKALWIIEFGRLLQGDKLRPSVEEVANTLRAIKADGIDAEGHRTVDADFAKEIHQAGFELHIWSKEDVVQLERFVELGVESITTNFPKQLKAVVASRANKPKDGPGIGGN